MAENRKVLPAYAGMILTHVRVASAGSGAPRIRGDDPYLVREVRSPEGCSPHTRG